MDIKQKYLNNIEDLKIQHARLKKKSAYWSSFRVIDFIVLILFIFYFNSLNPPYFVLGIILFVSLLLFGVRISLQIKKSIERLNILIDINENELKVIDQKGNRYYDGVKFSKEYPDLSNDLDLFDNHSVFHIINRASSYFGNERLKDYLIKLVSKEIIIERQEAVKELSELSSWRQEYQYELYNIDQKEDYTRITEHLNEKSFIEEKAKLFNFYFIQNYILLALFVSSLLFFSKYSFSIFILIFLINSFINIIYIQRTNKIHILVSGVADDLESFVNALLSIESKKWNSSLLKRLQMENNTFSYKIKLLKSHIQKFDFRLNMLMGTVLNIFLLWDLRIISKIDKWKKDNHDLNKHFKIIGEFEAISSFATLKENNPQYNFPKISEKEFEISAKNMLHPLISKKDVISNNYSIIGNSKLDIITGPNMSGKSTFLRSIGINMILARSGSIVFAEEFTFTPSKVLSYLHITDSVLEKVSTFKAEIIKLKRILDEIKSSDQPIFFILDEILRGTNSLSKYKGSVAIAKKLISLKASGIIATHDVKLGELEEEYKENINNYSFDFIQDENSELVYDYKLKNGINDRVNADIVLKELGLIL